MRTYTVALTGTTPLLMHQDDILWSDQLSAWRNVPKHKASSKAGDDRMPAWAWIGSLYHDGTSVVIPSDNVMSCLMRGGAMVPTGKGQKTFKSATQSGITPLDLYWAFDAGHGAIPIQPFRAGIPDEYSFDRYQELAAEHHFLLYLKRAKIGNSKHVRVRPRFDAWHASSRLLVTDEQITLDVLRSIFECAGRFIGLGDWRPGGKTPGPYGTFTAEVEME